ncbi:hypothetical protein, partial [Klebsiella pneumoniae]|uniref:hypothetical protein n=1 Tax=Klebsiella pneumoniae TaxID=573 RepID=UPI001D0F2CB0
PAYKKLQYQTVMQLAVGPRKRSAAGQALKIALCLQSDCLPLGEGILADDKPVSLLCPPYCRVAAFALPGIQKTPISDSYAVSCRPAQAQRRRAIA